VIVRARRHGESVTLEVRDNGDGLMGTIREGTGVRNTRERLLHLYGEGRQRFDLAADPEGGTVATVVLPFDTDDGPPDSFTVPTAPGKSSVAPVRREPAVPPSAAASVRAAPLRRRTS
jgi:hypothetical protein